MVVPSPTGAPAGAAGAGHGVALACASALSRLPAALRGGTRRDSGIKSKTDPGASWGSLLRHRVWPTCVRTRSPGAVSLLC